MAAPTRLVALLVALPFALGACGETTKDSATEFKGDQKDVAQTIEDLQEFARKKDAGKICTELLARPLVAQIRKSSGEPCDKALDDALADADAYELQVEKVAVNGDKATATVISESSDQDRTETLELVRDRAAWKISMLGAVPSASGS